MCKLKGTPEEEIQDWAAHLTEADYHEKTHDIAQRINEAARGWLQEIRLML